jgi:hypothetical protein
MEEAYAMRPVKAGFCTYIDLLDRVNLYDLVVMNDYLDSLAYNEHIAYKELTNG